VEHIDRTSPTTGRKVRDVLVSLRRTYGAQAPTYGRLWVAIQDGRIAVRHEPSCLVVEDDDATIAAALGLTPSQVAA
jgi:hypothetical protein